MIYSTNAIESLNARRRRASQARGRFPNEEAALTRLHLAIRSLDPTGKGRHRRLDTASAGVAPSGVVEEAVADALADEFEVGSCLFGGAVPG